jgi:hypothetical protein
MTGNDILRVFTQGGGIVSVTENTYPGETTYSVQCTGCTIARLLDWPRTAVTTWVQGHAATCRRFPQN